jgi:hypothetical protein
MHSEKVTAELILRLELIAATSPFAWKSDSSRNQLRGEIRQPNHLTAHSDDLRRHHLHDRLSKQGQVSADNGVQDARSSQIQVTSSFQASNPTLDRMSGVASSAVHPFQAQNNAFGRTRWEPSLRTRSSTNDCSLMTAECPDSATGAIHPCQPMRLGCHPYCAHSPELDDGWSTRRIIRGVVGRAGKLGTPTTPASLLGPASAFGRVSRCV